MQEDCTVVMYDYHGVVSGNPGDNLNEINFYFNGLRTKFNRNYMNGLSFIFVNISSSCSHSFLKFFISEGVRLNHSLLILWCECLACNADSILNG